MTGKQIAEGLKASREQSVEVDGPLSAHSLMTAANILSVKFDEIYVAPCGGEMLKISVPCSKPIRHAKMGEKA